jgi:hypothetical protein
MIGPRCPFYGKSGLAGVLWDSGGNQCALIVDRHAPCMWAIMGLRPDWERCKFILRQVEEGGREPADREKARRMLDAAARLLDSGEAITSA